MDTTLADLHNDFFELQRLCESGVRRLRSHQKDIQENAEAYMPATAVYLVDRAAQLLGRYADLSQAISIESERTENTDQSFEDLMVKKHDFGDRLRILQSELGSVLSAGNWQSPSVRHSHNSQAGNETGAIWAYINDYKRDRHKEGKVYARKFVETYIDHPHRLAPSGFVTSSGMAAVLTALSYLVSRVPKDSVVTAGNATYFQSRWILESLFPKRVRYVDENDTQAILEMARECKPSIIFFDTLSNNACAMIDVPTLLTELSKILPHSSNIVLDNTCLSIVCQPLRYLPFGVTCPRLIVVESLSKYHQFGLDRVAGGILWSPIGLSVIGLRTACANSGTIVSDVSVLSQPEPDRELFEKRLARIGRNTLRLARRIESGSKSKKSLITNIMYPGLSTHPAHGRANEQFYGGFFTCEFTTRTNMPFYKERLIEKILLEAKKRNIPLVHGAGFGFDITRLYILPEMQGVQKKLLRICVGTETTAEIDALGDIFESVLTGVASL